MGVLQDIIDQYGLMILDGAFATELERRGFQINDALWSANALASAPELIKAVHTDYFAAGADCAITASYQASVEGFQKKGFSEAEAERLIRLSVTLAKEARDHFWQNHSAEQRPKPLIAASVGPYGAFLADGSEYRGDYTVDEAFLQEFHRKRIGLLLAEKPDILACETIPCLMEAQAIAHVLQQWPEASAWISFSCRDEEHISNGEKIADCASWLDQMDQIQAIGLNCTAPQYVENLIREIRRHTDKPVLVYPNSGESYDAAEKDWHGESADFAGYTKLWQAAGARMIGGCCRTTPADIRSIAEWARG